MGANRLGHPGGEAVAIDRESGTGRHGGRLGDAQDERSQPAHLLLQEADGGIQGGIAEGVGAHQLGELPGAMRLRRALRPHLDEPHLAAGMGGVPGGLAARQTAADHRQGAGGHTASASATVSLYWHPSLRQRRTVPALRVVFSTTNGAPHSGQASGTGRSQVAKRQWG